MAWRSVLPKYDLDGSVSLGGPILKDKGLVLRHAGPAEPGVLHQLPPADLDGRDHQRPDYTQYKTLQGDPLLPQGHDQLGKSLRFFAMVQTAAFSPRCLQRRRLAHGLRRDLTLKNNSWTAATGELNWTLAPTRSFPSGRLHHRWYPITSRDEYRDTAAMSTITIAISTTG